MTERNPHLSDLFETGKEITLNFGEDKIVLWLEKPATVQQDDAMNRAKAKRARIMNAYRDPSSDLSLSIDAELLSHRRPKLLEQIAQLNEQDFRRQATQEVLHGPEGSDWGENGEDYLDLLAAIEERITEIHDHNEALADEDTHLALGLATDEELSRLEAKADEFSEEVTARVAHLNVQEERRLESLNDSALREMLRERRVELEAELAWYQEYRQRMLYYTVRYPDKHERLYFSNLDQMLNLPAWLQQQLLNLYDQFDQGGEDTKKLLSLLSSSDSSAPSKELVETSEPSGPTG